MPCAPLLRFSDSPADTRAEAGEVMSGFLEIIGGSNFTSTNSPSRSVNSSNRKTSTSSNNNITQRVFVRVYRTSSEHFAVLYPVRAIITACRPLASLNLKSCTVKPLPNCEFRVSPRSCEGMSVTFRGTESSSDKQISEWLKAFSEVQDQDPTSQRRKKVSAHRLPLPVLEESEEDVTE
ncbi:uncharacterized protein LOC118188356 [Stegodyphus dumicola]|uniref:uncharacterized protein LOC118188356 n=1 Tax=Stegodyphus dumicola TaxID=202533 RepID=UPI0015B23B64|nr:uncharacterized protein LOC118188356 [Stegodyphus dumicola]